MSTMAAILREDPKPASQIAKDLPLELERIITRCLQKDLKRRFQHMDDVKVELEELRQELDSGSLATAPPQQLGHRRWRIAAGLALLCFAGISAWFFYPRPHAWLTPLSVVPLTSYLGQESNGSFSPDGNQLAFTWNGDKQDNYDIYIKFIGPTAPLRLTTDPQPDTFPAWSPDGRWIAFLRRTGDNKVSLLLIAPTGGPERLLAENLDLIEGWWESLSWSPDGRWLALALKGFSTERGAIFAISVETVEIRRLTTPPAETVGDGTPAFSPDGRTLAFSRFLSGQVADLYLLPLSTDFAARGEPKQLTVKTPLSLSPVWTPDGREIIFISGQSHSNSLWRIASDGSSGPERLTPVGEQIWDLAISRPGHRLAFAQSNSDVNIWRAEVPGPDGKAKLPVSLIASTRLDHTPQYSPDGKRIAFASYRSGNAEIWVCNSDGSNAVQLTSMDGPHAANPRWSPDGKQIVFDSNQEGQNEIYVISAQGGKPKRLTAHPANDEGASWSRDGQWVFFGSNRSGPEQVWKLSPAGGDAVQVTKDGGYLPFESIDGKTVYYLKDRRDFTGLWQVPLEGGEERQVLESVYAENYTVVSRGIYFMAGATGRFTIQFFRFATGKITQIAPIERLPMYGFSVSPDERWILYPQVDQQGSDLMLVENFR